MSQGLSPQQTRALELRANGYSYGEIAEGMGVSTHSVKEYLMAARWKLGARNSTHAVVIAARAGMLGEQAELYLGVAR